MSQPDDRRVRLKDLLNAQEVADELGIGVNSVYVYRHRYPDFPQPVITHGRCLLWHRGDIRRWMRARERKR